MQPYGSNALGAYMRVDTTPLTLGEVIRTGEGQQPQNAHLVAPAPYTLFGLTDSPNTVDNFYLTIPYTNKSVCSPPHSFIAQPLHLLYLLLSTFNSNLEQIAIHSWTEKLLSFRLFQDQRKSFTPPPSQFIDRRKSSRAFHDPGNMSCLYSTSP